MVDKQLRHDLGAPAEARAHVDDLGLPSERREALKLVVSELVTNAVLHGEGPVCLRLRPKGGTIEGEVADGGDGFSAAGGRPAPRPDNAEGGRGLFLVDALCSRWEVDPGRSRVRFEFAKTG